MDEIMETKEEYEMGSPVKLLNRRSKSDISEEYDNLEEEDEDEFKENNGRIKRV